MAVMNLKVFFFSCIIGISFLSLYFNAKLLESDVLYEIRNKIDTVAAKNNGINTSDNDVDNNGDNRIKSKLDAKKDKRQNPWLKTGTTTIQDGLYTLAPIWSTYRRQQHTNATEFDAQMIWNLAGKNSHVHTTRRAASEILTYGLAGVLPWFGYRLPAMRFNPPFENTTQVEMVMVEGVVDAFLDLHHCSKGGDGETGPDGYYDVCFPNITGRSAAKRLCFEKDKVMLPETRLRHFPSPGHERWSCSDHQIIEQLVGAQVIDYLIMHGDRFYDRRTNNLFFSLKESPLLFVSIDHNMNPCKFFKSIEFDERVKLNMLKEYSLPSQLYEEIKGVVTGPKEEFERRLNDVLNGELDNVDLVVDREFSNYCPGIDKTKSTSDMIWDRLQSVARFYKMKATIDEGNQL